MAAPTRTEHNVSLISTLAAGFGLALLLGFAAERARLPALVGYLVAGIVIGPATPGFAADVGIASQLSELGVMPLMFGVGLHFSLADLLAVRRIAVPGAVVQMGLATVLGMAMSLGWGWSWGEGLVFGLSLSCASTVVLLKALEFARRARDDERTHRGRPAGGRGPGHRARAGAAAAAGRRARRAGAAPGAGGAGWAIARTLLEVGAFIALMLVAGRRLLPWLLYQVARTGSGELFTLAVVAAAIGIAYGAANLFNVSFALGAFFAGMVMRESEFSHRAAQESLPLRDAFSVLFFVAVGMLFDPVIVLERPLWLLGVVAVIIVGKSAAALGLVLALGYPLSSALMVAASLAQIGEFSFILAGLGLSLGLLPAEGVSLVLAAALISIALNPFMFGAVEPMRRWVLARSALARRLERRDDPYAELPAETGREVLRGQVVLVSHGRVGARIARALAERGAPFVLVDRNRELVEGLRKEGVAAVAGDAADPAVLVQAHIADAAMLVVAVPDPVRLRVIVQTARTLNPRVDVVLRTRSEEELQLLRRDVQGEIFNGEEVLAAAMTQRVLQLLQAPRRSASDARSAPA